MPRALSHGGRQELGFWEGWLACVWAEGVLGEPWLRGSWQEGTREQDGPEGNKVGCKGCSRNLRVSMATWVFFF